MTDTFKDPLSPSSSDIKAYVQRGLVDHQAGRFEDAIRHYEGALHLDSHQLDALQLMAVAYAQQGKQAKAIPFFERALAIDTHNPGLHANYAKALSELGRWSDAIVSYRLITTISPEAAEGYFGLGTCYEHLGEIGMGLSAYEKAFALDPHFHQAAAAMANILRSQKKYALSLHYLEAAITLAPQELSYGINRSLLLFDLDSWEEAYESIQAVLRANNSLSAAHNIKATIEDRLDRPDDALDSFDAALALAPGNVEALFNKGLLQRKLKNDQEALSCFESVLKVDSQHIEARYQKVMTRVSLEQLGGDALLKELQEILNLNPLHVSALNSLGLELRAQKKNNEALATFERAVALEPDYALGHLNLGALFVEKGNCVRALAEMDHAISLDTQLFEAHVGRAQALMGLSRLEEALISANLAISLKPERAETYANRGMLLAKMRRHQEALESFEAALHHDPKLVDTYINRMDVYRLEGRLEEAFADAQKVMALPAELPEFYNNLAMIHQENLSLDLTRESLDRALLLDPSHADSRFNKGLLALLEGNLVEGALGYEWRWRTPSSNGAREFHRSLWLGGEALDGKTILISSEQGMGDAIQYARYLPMLADQAREVYVELPPPLLSLFKTLPGEYRWVELGRELPQTDVYCPLMSLPLAFKTELSTIPCKIPYLKAPSENALRWHQKLGAKVRPRVGVAWSGNPRHTNDRKRSIPLEIFSRLFDLPFDFHVLQKGLDEPGLLYLKAFDQVSIHEEYLGDFSDTAALLQEMDLVISVDTSIVHLAGAIGKPVWVLLAYCPDHRWLLDRLDSPWYPSSKLFRQKQRGDWEEVLEVIKVAAHHSL